MSWRLFRPILIILFLVAWSSGKSLAQRPYFEEENFPTPVAAISLVNGIATDINNCVWLTTQSGLYRYDGNKFKHYSTLNTTALKFERMESMQKVLSTNSLNWCVRDAKRNLYQVDPLSQLRELNPDTSTQIIFGHFNLEISKDNKRTNIMIPGRDILDVQYVKTRDLFYILLGNGDMMQASRSQLLKGEKPTFIAATLFEKKFSPGTLQQFKIFTTDHALYCVSTNSLLRLDGIKNETRPVSMKGDILYEKGDHDYRTAKIFPGTGNTAILMWYRGNIYELTESFDDNTLNTRLLVRGRSADTPSFLFYSPAHQLLLGCFLNRGLISYRPHQFSLLTYSDSTATYSENYHYAILKGENGYVTANNSGIVQLGLDGRNRILYKGDVNTFFLFRDKSGNIWSQLDGVKTGSNKIFYLKAGTTNIVPVLDPGYDLTSVYQLNDSTYYLLTERNLQKLSFRAGQHQVQILYKAREGTNLSLLYQKDPQTLWLGYDLGLIEFNLLDNSAKDVPDLHNANVRAMTKLADHIFLAGTYDKWIYQYKNGRWKHLTTADKTTPSSVHAFITDSSTNSLWISSNLGVSRIPLHQVLAMNDTVVNEIYAEHFANFGKDISVEFNGANNTSAATFSDSNAAFANASGVVMFNPQMTFSSPLPTNVLIEPIQRPDSVASKDTDSRQLEFSVVVPYFGSRENLEILYKLTNSDENWHRLFPNAIISYNNLKPGNHDLLFRIKHYGDITGREVTISAGNFNIPYRWYETTWFRIGVVMLALLLLISFHYFRIWYILKRKRELEKTVKMKTGELQETNQRLVAAVDELKLSEAELKESNFLKDEYYAVLTHDLRSPLKFLSFNIRQLLEYAPDLKDQGLKNGLFAAYQCSNEVYKLIDEFVYWIQDNEKQIKVQPVATNILAVVEDAKKIYELNFEANKNRFITEISPDLSFDTDPKLLFIVLRNAIDNANKYTTGGTITVSAFRQHDDLLVTVADSGRGITEDQVKLLTDLQYGTVQLSYKQRKSLGFYIMAMLTKLLGGSYTITSTRNDGTSVSFKIPELKTE